MNFVDRDTPVPVVTVLSHIRGQAYTEQIENPVILTRAKIPEPNKACTDLQYQLATLIWRTTGQTTTALLTQVYKPKKAPLEITEIPFKLAAGEAPFGIRQLTKQEQRDAGNIPTGQYSMCALLTPLDAFLDERNSEATRAEGYYQPLKEDLQQKLQGHLHLLSNLSPTASEGEKELHCSPPQNQKKLSLSGRSRLEVTAASTPSVAKQRYKPTRFR